MNELSRNKNSDNLKKRMGIKVNFGNCEFIINQLAAFLKEGDFSSSTDLIAAYISNSSKYKNQDEFAQAIGTTRQTLHRMFAHENVSLNIFFKAIERIYDDRD